MALFSSLKLASALSVKLKSILSVSELKSISLKSILPTLKLKPVSLKSVLSALMSLASFSSLTWWSSVVESNC